MKIENRNILQDIVYFSIGIVLVLSIVVVIMWTLALMTEVNTKAMSECTKSGYSMEYCERMAR
jgi:hypothetical protein